MSTLGEPLVLILSSWWRLFFRKQVSLLLAVILLVPLVYFRFRLPSLIYLLGLLILHLYFVYVYLSRISWRELANHKAVLAGRIAAVLSLATS